MIGHLLMETNRNGITDPRRNIWGCLIGAGDDETMAAAQFFAPHAPEIVICPKNGAEALEFLHEWIPAAWGDTPRYPRSMVCVGIQADEATWGSLIDLFGRYGVALVGLFTDQSKWSQPFYNLILHLDSSKGYASEVIIALGSTCVDAVSSFSSPPWQLAQNATHHQLVLNAIARCGRCFYPVLAQQVRELILHNRTSASNLPEMLAALSLTKATRNQRLIALDTNDSKEASALAVGLEIERRQSRLIVLLQKYAKQEGKVILVRHPYAPNRAGIRRDTLFFPESPISEAVTQFCSHLLTFLATDGAFVSTDHELSAAPHCTMISIGSAVDTTDQFMRASVLASLTGTLVGA